MDIYLLADGNFRERDLMVIELNTSVRVDSSFFSKAKGIPVLKCLGISSMHFSYKWNASSIVHFSSVKSSLFNCK